MLNVMAAFIHKEFENLKVKDVRETGKELGRGSYGVVNEALWRGTPCVTKRLHKELETEGKPFQDFVQECRTWSNLRHPNIVQLYGVFFEAGISHPVLVLELMMTSLRAYLENTKKDEVELKDKVLILHQVVLGLAYLHGQDHVHRDLSTNNILLNTTSILTKITDFGVARALDSETKIRKATGILPGTEHFMPPECFDHSCRYDAKLDVFSFGCVMISTLAHKWPTPGPIKVLKNKRYVSVSEFERRVHLLNEFARKEKAYFQPIIKECLNDIAAERVKSTVLVEHMTQCMKEYNVGSVTDRVKDLKARITLLSEEIEARKSHEVGLRQTIVNYSGEKERLESAIQELQKELEVKTAMEEQLTVQLQTFEQDFQQERKDRENAHGKIANLEEKHRKELEEVSTDRDEKVAQLIELKQQLLLQKNELHRMNRELEHMKGTSTDYEQKLIKQEEQFMKRENALLQQKERLDQEVKKSKTEIQQLMRTNKEYSKKQRNLKQFEAAYLTSAQNAHQLEQQVEALQKTQHAISQQVRDLQAEKVALESRNKELKQLTDHVTAENERLNNQVQYVLQQNRSLESEVKHLKENNQCLEEERKEKEQQIKRLELELQKLWTYLREAESQHVHELQPSTTAISKSTLETTSEATRNEQHTGESESNSSLQSSSKGLFPHRRSALQKNMKATAAERSENASFSSLPHHSSSQKVPQETEPHVPQSGDTKMPAVKKELLAMSTKEEVKQLQDQLKQLQDKLTDKEAKLSETHVVRDELLKEKRMLKENIKQMEQEVIKKEEATKESAQLKGRLTQLQGELATPRAKPEELEAVMKERDDLVKKKAEIEKEIHITRLKREKIVKDLKEEKKKSDKVITEQQKHIEELKSKLEEDNQVKYGIKDAIGEEPKRSVSLERSASMGSATATEKQVAAPYLKQIEDLKSEKDTLETELKKAKQHHQHLAEYCKKLDGERDALAIELKQLQDEQALKEATSPPKSKMEGDHLKEGIVYQQQKSQEDQERKEGISQTEGAVSEKGRFDLKQMSHIRQQLSDQREKIRRLEKEKEELEKASKIPSTQQVEELKKQLDDATKTIHNLEDQLKEMTVKWTRELETVKKLHSEHKEQWDWRREESLREKETAKDQLRDYENDSHELTDRSKSSPETSVTIISVQVKNPYKQKKKDEEKVKQYNKEIETLKQEKCKIEKEIVLLGGKPEDLLKLDDSLSYSESLASSYSLPVQPRKGKDTKKFNKDLKRINDLVKKLRSRMEQIEEVEKKKEKRLKNIVAEMSGESKESKKQSVSSSSLQSSSKGSFPARRSSPQKNKKATAAERSENAPFSRLPHLSSPEVPQETEQHVAELVRELKEKDKEIEHLKIEKEVQTTEAQKESQRSQEGIKKLAT